MFLHHFWHHKVLQQPNLPSLVCQNNISVRISLKQIIPIVKLDRGIQRDKRAFDGKNSHGVILEREPRGMCAKIQLLMIYANMIESVGNEETENCSRKGFY